MMLQVIIISSLFILISSMQIDLRLYKDTHSMNYSSNFEIDNYFLYLIPICIGTPPQCFHVFYDVNYTHLLINPIPKNNSHHFMIKDSSTAENSAFPVNIYGDSSESINDKIIVEMNSFSFDWLYGVNVPKTEVIYDGKFGFGRNYDNSSDLYHEKYSLIHRLYNSGKIKRKIFRHKFFNNRKYMRLYFGEINLEELNNNQNYPKCYAKDTTEQLNQINKDLNHLWSCGLKSVKIIDDSNEKIVLFEYFPPDKNIVLFSTVSNIITGPIEQGEKLIDYLVSLPFAKGLCTKNKYHKDRINIRCDWKTDITQFPNIIFELNGVKLVLLSKDLFHKEYGFTQENYSFKGRFDFTPYNQFWTIGENVLRNYDMIFDMDEGSVGFWNVTPERQNENSFLKALGYYH